MRTASFLVAAALLTAAAPPPTSKTYKGVITDSMCSREHAAMKIAPESKCVRDCVGDGKTYKYALLVGENLYLLSDQETPARFAAQRVEVTGVLYEKTKILKVEAIKPIK